MTTLFSDDFESGDFSAWTSTHMSNGTIAVSTVKSHLGVYSCLSQISGSSGYADVWKQFAQGYGDVNARVYYLFQNLDAVPEGTKVTFQSLFTNDELHIGLTRSGGTLYWYIWAPTSGLTVVLTSVSSPVDNEWYCIESKIVKSTTNGQVSLWINGVNVYSVAGLNNNTNNIQYFGVGLRFRSGTSLTGTLSVYCDSAAFSDGSYIGPLNLSVSLSDSFSLTDNQLRNKPLLALVDGIWLVENSSVPARLKEILDSIIVGDGVFVSRVLVINDNAIIVEIVEKTVVKRTRLFLILGDLAIQLIGD